MTLIRRILLAAALLVSAVPTFAQAPAPVPALPDSERRTSYSITGTTCACAVNMALFGDGSDYQNWVEVFLNGTRVNYNDATFGWTITSPSGPIANLARPISNAVLTFNSVQTGTVQIIGARRPRRTSQFSENRGVAARDLNQALTDIISQNREIWDKTNDTTGRALLSQPGNTIGLLPLPSACANKFLSFDVTGLIPQCLSGAGSGNVIGPATTAVGNIAWYNGLDGTLLGAAPAFHGGNPGSAALYSQLANPANGYTTLYNGMYVALGTPLPAGEQFGNGQVGMQQAIIGSVQSDAGDTTGNTFGVAGIAKTNSAAVNAVGIGGYGKCAAANSNCWGSNFVVHNISPYAVNTGVNANWMAAQENDVNVWKGPGGVNPTINNVFGLYIYGGGDSTANQGSGVAVAGLSAVTGAKFTNGFWAVGGCCVTAFLAGPTAHTGNSLASQAVAFSAVDSGGATLAAQIFEDSFGNLIFQSPTTGAVDIGDANGNYIVTSGTLSGAKVRLPATAGTAGVIVNDTSGNLSSSARLSVALGGTGLGSGTSGGIPYFSGSTTIASSAALSANAIVVGGGAGVAPSTITTGTGVVTALGVNIGTAGSFVVNGGALGSPSSAGTLPAHTLGGTISGGGNQINNVVIGASTPLAGTFTTLTAGGDGSTATIGPGGTGALNAFLKLNGANATSQGADIKFTKNDTSANSWFLGHVSAVEAAGTSSDLEYFNQNTSVRTVRLSIADDSAAFAGNVAATSAATGTVKVNNGLSATGAIWAGTYMNITPTVVNSLPACVAGLDGARAFVTNNATAVSFGGAVTTGGTTHSPVYCDGSATAWKQG